MSVHNEAKPGDIAPFVLLPGDPLRAKLIAETYLTDAKCYNNVRGMMGFTGYYKGRKVSVQGTGMGMPSLSIYVTELIIEYGVESLVRIGSCGAIQEDVNIMDVVLPIGASTDSAMNKVRFKAADYAAVPDFSLLKKAYEVAHIQGLNIHVGNILTSDFFYNDEHLGDPFLCWKEYGVIGVDMETTALYTIAAKYRKKAMSILTVSDHILRHEAISPDQRLKSFSQMIELALELS